MHAKHIRRIDSFLVRRNVLLNIKDRFESSNWN